MMERIRVAHFMDPFLPLTQNWMYNQLVFNTRCDSIVLCRTLVNRLQFPFEKVFAAYPRTTVWARMGMFVARARAQYPTGFAASVVAREKPDLFHGHFAWESWRNRALVARTGIPLVTTFYGLDVSKLPRRGAWRRRYPVLFRMGAAFMAEGGFMAGQLEKLGCPREKIYVVHLGVDIERIQRQAGSRAPRGDTVRILFVGLEREKKGAVDTARAFVTAARESGPMELHVVGDGPYREKVRNIVRDGGVERFVHFHGYIPVERYLELLLTTDIVMAPSVTARDGDTEGGAPVTIIEAQAAGIPVVGTLHCDIPEVVLHDRTGLLCAEHDIAALAANLSELTRNGELRGRFGAAARVHAREQHDLHRQVDKISRVYETVLDRGRRPA